MNDMEQEQPSLPASGTEILEFMSNNEKTCRRQSSKNGINGKVVGSKFTPYSQSWQS